MPPRYSLDQGALDDHIVNLIRMCGDTPNTDLVKEIIITALKLVQEKADRGDIKILNATLRELRYAFKLFHKYRHIRKVTVFGSARTGEQNAAYDQAVAFAREIVKKGFMVITGAGDGIMKGAQEGAGREKSFGVNIQLPFEQAANIYIENDPKLVTFKYFFTRKLIFVKETDAIALFPGGFGTQDEGFETLTLVQTGKTDPVPIVLIDQPGGSYWWEWKRHIEHQFLRPGFISEEDMALFKVTDQVEEAVSEILTFYSNYHSSRYVGDRLVIRLQRPPDDALLDKLNAEFSDLLTEGKIERCGSFPEEMNEPDTVQLPRLSLCFNRRNFGRLRQMINVVNASA
jgi:uncharacterized protein (TIGR00730 family)